MIKSRALLAVLGGVSVFGVALASAASLGGLTSDALGSEDVVVASCDTDGIDLEYTTVWDAGDATYEVSEVVLTDVDAACVGQDLSVTLSDGTDALIEVTQVVTGATETAPVSPAVSAEAVTHASVLITG